MENYLVYFRQLNLESMLLRIALAMLLGGVIGFERELKRRPAGFRTYMLVAMGAALTMILSQYLNLMFETKWAADFAAVGAKSDQVRLGAQVISGIGFIGTGTILVTKRNGVKGLTTASCLWTSACMGLAIGAGFYEAFIIGFVLIIFIIKVLPLVENLVIENARNMNVYVELESIENLGNLVSYMKANNMSIYDVEIDKEKDGGITTVNGLFSLSLPRKQYHTQVLAQLSTLDGIIAIEEV